MRGWVLDTNIISETRRPKPSQSVLDWMAAQPRALMFTTSVTIAEIRFGISMLASARDGETFTAWLEGTIRPQFKGKILEAGEDAILKWRQLARDVAQRRQPSPPADLLIAAIASLHAFAVATRDAAPFVAAGVPVYNPFTGERFNGA